MKTLHLLSALTLAMGSLALAGCNDDNNLPDVTVNVEFENAIVSDGQIYVTPGTDLEVTGITVTNNEAGKKAIITGAYFYWDYVFVGASVVPPYTFKIAVPDDAEVNTSNLLEITFPVYAEGKAPANGVVAYTVNVVAAEDMPEAPANAVKTTPTFKVAPKE